MDDRAGPSRKQEEEVPILPKGDRISDALESVLLSEFLKRCFVSQAVTSALYISVWTERCQFLYPKSGSNCANGELLSRSPSTGTPLPRRPSGLCHSGGGVPISADDRSDLKPARQLETWVAQI